MGAAVLAQVNEMRHSNRPGSAHESDTRVG